MLSSAAAAPAPATPAKIDLDRFDALKRTVALPNGETLAYVPLGDPAGPAIVLVHGYTDNARDWVPLVPYLSRQLRLILIDLRGHGRSSRPECCYSRWDFAYDIKLLLDALSVRHADLVGHSLGSIIAQTFAEVWPERTGRVILISSTAGAPDGGAPSKTLSGLLAEIRQLKEPIEADSPFMMQWWSSPTPVDPDFMRRERRDSAASPLRVWLAVLDQSIATEFASGELRLTLPRLTAPVLLLWGSRDPLIDAPMRRTLRDALPQAQVKVFEGLGHNPIWEDPAGCAAAINTFLRAAPAGGVAPH